SERFERARIQPNYIGRIREASDPEARAEAEPVVLPERQHLEMAYAKRLIFGDDPGTELRPIEPVPRLDRFEGIGKALPDRSERTFRPEGIDRPSHDIVESSDVVQTVHMIGVCMGVEDRVDVSATGVKQLLPYVRPRVHEDRQTSIFDQDRWPAAAVLRVGGVTGSPFSGCERHTARAAATENSYAHWESSAGTLSKSL